MSLLVHELLIGTGGGGSGASNLQTSPSNPVPIASVTVTHSNSTVQVAHLQNRVVTITSSQSRPTSADKGSRLASALAGNPPYSYSSNSSHRFARLPSQSRHSLSHVLTTSAAITSTPSDSLKPSKALSSSRQTYILPFVLQDHNYGAPPPPTPPHSPPPPPPSVSSVTSPQPSSYKVHQVFPPSVSTPLSPKAAPSDASYTQTKKQGTNIVSEPSLITVSDVTAVQVSPSPPCGEVLASSNPPPSIASQIMASMPLHRQQFMPHPKAPLYPSSHIPPTTMICESLVTPTVSLPTTGGGQDTDEESRLSDRSSSVGPSGEETETAPEGEGEEQIQADDSITRCICNFTHDDGYMIQCDRCFVWQHVDCMEIDRNNIPDEYLCEACKPRLTDKSKARSLQVRRRQEIRAHLARISSSDSEDNSAPRNKSSSGKSQERKVLKKKKPKPSKENKSNRKQSLTSTKGLSTGAASSTHPKPLSSDERESKPSGIKSRRRQSTLSGSSGAGEDCSSTTFTLEQLRSWIDVYEVAVTNHYSPELRAKVHAARINGISAEFRESTQGALLGHRCRVAPSYDVGPDSFEDKILVAATRLQPGTAIIEYQGKYTLKSQWSSVQIPPGLPYLPFVLQYNMQKEGLSVCVDARTYGNDARFARRSSNNNAEILHVVERGSVHLYIVACKEIEEEEEIILPLETAICLQNVPMRTSPFAQTNIAKDLGNEKMKDESSQKVPSINSQIRKNGIFSKKNVSRKPLLTLALPQPLNRTSRRTASSDSHSCDDTSNQTPASVSPTKQRRSSGCGGSRSPAKCPLKSPSKSPSKAPPIDDSSSGDSPHQESPGSDKMDSHKMTREERKIAAYMKAFERMEKAAQRRQEMEKRKVEDRGKKGSNPDDDDGNRTESADESVKPLHQEKKGKRAKESPNKSDYFEDDNNGSSSEGERKLFDGPLQGYSSPPSSGITSAGFRFPKTKKALMNEWLNETIDPVLHSTPPGGEIATGVPTCYMRSPSTPMRRNSGSVGSGTPAGVVEMAGRSAKKRWLRQAIIDETDPQATGFSLCSSPNSRPDSPTSAGDYITPLKKRRLARESMSSEQSNTPPSTPVHPGFEEKYNEEMEIDHVLESLDPEEKETIKGESKEFVTDLKMEFGVKKEEPHDNEYDENDLSDRLTINISRISAEIKAEPGNVDAKAYPKFSREKSPAVVKVKIEEEIESSKQSSADSRNEKKTVALVSEDSLQRKSKLEKSPPQYSGKIKEIEDEKGKRRTKNTSSPKVSSSKSRKKVKPKKGEKPKKKIKKNLDKNRNMETRKQKFPSQKIKQKKLERLKTRKREQSPLSEPEMCKLSALNSPSCIKETESKDRSISSDVEEEDNVHKDEAVTTTTTKEDSPSPVAEISLDLEDWKGEEKKGPRTPDGTPPENAVRDDFSNPTENICDNPPPLDETPAESDNNQIKDAMHVVDVSPSKSENVAENSPQVEAFSSLENFNKEHSTVKSELNQSSSLLVTTIPAKPAAVKRKLSILEYRKRKSVSSEGESRDTFTQKNVQGVPSDAVTGSDDITTAAQGNPTLENLSKAQKNYDSSSSYFPVCLADLSTRPLPPLSPSLMSESLKLEKAKLESGSVRTSSDDSRDVKWNAAPTLVEQQRENFTARLRREYGLCLPEDNLTKLKLGEKSIKEKWNDIDKRYPFPGKRTTPTSLGLTSSLYAVPSQNSSGLIKPSPKVNSLLHLSDGGSSFSNPNLAGKSDYASGQAVTTTDFKASGFNFSNHDKVSLAASSECDTKIPISPSSLLVPVPKTKLPPSICTSSDVQGGGPLPSCEFDSLTRTEIEGNKNSAS